MRLKIILVLAFGLAVFTQCFQITAVPGLHFDEAWQGTFAVRILNERGFFPTSAMNSYTSPIVHYLLAVVFKLFSPSLLVMRASYAFCNLLALAVFLTLLVEKKKLPQAIWFTLLWALLPLSVHTHRFFVEMTGFFTICLAAVIWGVARWNKNPTASALSIFLGIVLATYSHILFVAVYFGGIIYFAATQLHALKQKRARLLVGLTGLAIAPLPIRMGLGLHKSLPFLLALALVTTAILFLISPQTKLLKHLWAKAEKSSTLALRTSAWLAIPFLVSFVGLLWNGNWPYAQATGHLELWWLPINAFIFLALCIPMYFVRNKKITIWHAFTITFLISSVLILKQVPRYYTVPIILAIFWLSDELAKRGRTAISVAVLFIAWNGVAFNRFYIDQFNTAGPTTEEFRLGPFHDNGRDFRPFQKAFAWLVENGCQKGLEWVEDDRFLHPVNFLKFTAPDPRKNCPWPTQDLFFSHIPNYDPNFTQPRTDQNTPPPWPNVKYLAHFKEWGDLAFWIRR